MQTTADFQIVFRGHLLAGFSPESVSANLVQLTGLSVDRADQLLHSTRVVLKTFVKQDDALCYQRRMEKIGLQVDVVGPDVIAPDAETRVSPFGLTLVPKEASADVSATDNWQYMNRTVRRLPIDFAVTGGIFFPHWIRHALLTIITLGIYQPWAADANRHYLMSHISIDSLTFSSRGSPSIVLVNRLLVVAGIVLYTQAQSRWLMLAHGLEVSGILLLPWLVLSFVRERIASSLFAGVPVALDISYWRVLLLMMLTVVATVASAGLLLPAVVQHITAAVVGRMRLGVDGFSFHLCISDGYRSAFWFVLGMAVAVVMPILVYLVEPMAGAVAAVVAGLVGYCWIKVVFTRWLINHTQIADHGFYASHSVPDYCRVFLGNLIALMLTAGLYYPWAKVRAMRYWLGHMQVIAEGSLHYFVEQQKQSAVEVAG